ncbi:MAG: NAD(P)/FAD-dependent oxidoreductase [Alphaproteobacteria bacterium]|nr:NAD(P)/FAD-dependent oxidoreductase [Alphaproteobacteria bacterium]
MIDTEVLVIGGGPGGSATALQLARRGHAVTLLDRAEFPREKVCGEGLMPYGVGELRRLGVELIAQVDARPFLGIGYTVGSESAEGRFPSGHHGLGVRRNRLDLALAGFCREAGVDRRHGLKVREVGGWPGRMWADVGGRQIRARAIVGADGMHSVVRKSLGLQRPARGRPRYGLRGHFRLARGARALDLVEVHATDGLELYLTPTGDRELNVAVLLERDATKALKGDVAGGFARILAAYEPLRELLDGAESASEPALCGPLRQEATRAATDGAVLVGDAAGFLDGITGEGMSLTLLSARLAAEALSEGLRTGRLAARHLAAYERRRWRASRDLTWLTEIVLAGIRHRRLARRVVRGLRRHPEIFEQVLAINAGTGRLADVGVRNLLKVLL